MTLPLVSPVMASKLWEEKHERSLRQRSSKLFYRRQKLPSNYNWMLYLQIKIISCFTQEKGISTDRLLCLQNCNVYSMLRYGNQNVALDLPTKMNTYQYLLTWKHSCLSQLILLSFIVPVINGTQKQQSIHSKMFSVLYLNYSTYQVIQLH